MLPTRVHAIVLVSKLHKPTLRALAFAKATRPNVLEGVYVSTDPDATSRLLEEWDERNIGVPLKVLHSPYRELVRPIVEYATEIRRANPRGVVAVYIPEYVVGRWWEQLLHNQTALRLKGRLLFTPGVMVTSVPYQLRSSEIAREREEREDDRVRPGDLRRGNVDDDAARDRQVAPMTRRPPAAAGARPVPGGRAVRGRGRPGRARRPLRRPGHRRRGRGRVRPARAAGGAGRSSRSPRAPRATGSGGATRSRCSTPSRRPGRRRRARTPGRDAAAAATSSTSRSPGSARSRPTWCASSWPGSPGSRWTSWCEAVPGDEEGLRWRTRQRYVALPRRPARACASTARTTSCPVDDCLIAGEPTAAVVRRCAGADVRGRRGRVLAGAPGRAARCWSTTVLDAARAAAGRAVLDLYAGVGLFARSCRRRRARGSGGRGRGRPRPPRPRRGQPARTRPRSRPAPSSGCSRTAYDEPGRPGRARPAARGRRSGRSSSRSSTGRRGRSRTSPATRPPWPATSRSSPSTATGCAALRAFDLFPMTHHVECVALLEKTGSDLRRSDSR